MCNDVTNNRRPVFSDFENAFGSIFFLVLIRILCFLHSRLCANVMAVQVVGAYNSQPTHFGYSQADDTLITGNNCHQPLSTRIHTFTSFQSFWIRNYSG